MPVAAPTSSKPLGDGALPHPKLAQHNFASAHPLPPPLHPAAQMTEFLLVAPLIPGLDAGNPSTMNCNNSAKPDWIKAVPLPRQSGMSRAVAGRAHRPRHTLRRFCACPC